ncbi:hypothetical protein SMC26_40345 [Actinomadura fulvescens]|uniref:Uncharacterized protein n=1 Tax=Actinomadura fulvescens TaxID=46160 RepID=A0ABN3Q731_9ACTN
MRAWTEMTAADFYTDGTQLDMLAGIEGDGYGTLDLLDAAVEGAAPEVIAERADGALFGLALVPAGAGDDVLFSVVAA